MVPACPSTLYPPVHPSPARLPPTHPSALSSLSSSALSPSCFSPTAGAAAVASFEESVSPARWEVFVRAAQRHPRLGAGSGNPGGLTGCGVGQFPCRQTYSSRGGIRGMPRRLAADHKSKRTPPVAMACHGCWGISMRRSVFPRSVVAKRRNGEEHLSVVAVLLADA